MQQLQEGDKEMKRFTVIKYQKRINGERMSKERYKGFHYEGILIQKL